MITRKALPKDQTKNAFPRMAAVLVAGLAITNHSCSLPDHGTANQSMGIASGPNGNAGAAGAEVSETGGTGVRPGSGGSSNHTGSGGSVNLSGAGGASGAAGSNLAGSSGEPNLSGGATGTGGDEPVTGGSAGQGTGGAGVGGTAGQGTGGAVSGGATGTGGDEPVTGGSAGQGTGGTAGQGTGGAVTGGEGGLAGQGISGSGNGGTSGQGTGGAVTGGEGGLAGSHVGGSGGDGGSGGAAGSSGSGTGGSIPTCDNQAACSASGPIGLINPEFGVGYIELQDAWTSSTDEFDSMAMARDFEVYTITFWGPGMDQIGINVCHVETNGDYTACKPDNMRFATETHNMSMKLFGQTWTIVGLDAPDGVLTNEIQMAPGGSITITKLFDTITLTHGQPLEIDPSYMVSLGWRNKDTRDTKPDCLHKIFIYKPLCSDLLGQSC